MDKNERVTTTMKRSAWLWLLLTIAAETSATSSLKFVAESEGNIKILLISGVVFLYCITYFSLSKAVKYLPVGLAYATWSGTGILTVLGLAVLFYGQIPDLPAILGAIIIASGILIMNLYSKMEA